MNRCPEHIVDLMHTYLDGDIRHDEEADLRAHLSSCQECRTLMDELKETVLLFNQVEPSNWAFRSGWLLPSRVLRLAWQL